MRRSLVSRHAVDIEPMVCKIKAIYLLPFGPKQEMSEDPFLPPSLAGIWLVGKAAASHFPRASLLLQAGSQSILSLAIEGFMDSRYDWFIALKAEAVTKK